MAIKQAEMEVSAPVKFVSKCHNQILTMKPKRTQIVDGIPFVVEGEHIRFERFEYTTENPKEIEYIRKHRLFGHQITEAAGM